MNAAELKKGDKIVTKYGKTYTVKSVRDHLVKVYETRDYIHSFNILRKIAS